MVANSGERSGESLGRTKRLPHAGGVKGMLTGDHVTS